jgi:cytidine deaminase
MTNEDIIRMAQDVGAARLHSTGNIIFGVNALQHFVELIVAAEREACAVIAFNAKTYLEAAAAIRARGLNNLNKEAEQNGEQL